MKPPNAANSARRTSREGARAVVHVADELELGLARKPAAAIAEAGPFLPDDAAGLLQGAVGQHDHAADRADAGLGREHAERRGQRPGTQHGVVVQQQDRIAPRLRRRLVGGMQEMPVFRIADDARTIQPVEQRAGLIGGRVVDDDDFQRNVADRRDRAQAGQGQRRLVIQHQQDRHRRRGRRGNGHAAGAVQQRVELGFGARAQLLLGGEVALDPARHHGGRLARRRQQPGAPGASHQAMRQPRRPARRRPEHRQLSLQPRHDFLQRLFTHRRRRQRRA